MPKLQIINVHIIWNQQGRFAQHKEDFFFLFGVAVFFLIDKNKCETDRENKVAG